MQCSSAQEYTLGETFNNNNNNSMNIEQATPIPMLMMMNAIMLPFNVQQWKTASKCLFEM